MALDDFCPALYEWQSKQAVKPKAAINIPLMSDSELLTVLVFYHFFSYKCFEYYYHQQLKKERQS